MVDKFNSLRQKLVWGGRLVPGSSGQTFGVHDGSQTRLGLASDILGRERQGVRELLGPSGRC